MEIEPAPPTRGADNFISTNAPIPLLSNGRTDGRNPQPQRKETGYVRLYHPMDARGPRLKVCKEDRQQHDKRVRAPDIWSASKTWSELEAEGQLQKRVEDTWAGKFLMAVGKGRLLLGKAMRQVGGNVMRTAIQAEEDTTALHEYYRKSSSRPGKRQDKPCNMHGINQ
eukprot:748630-Hanusia_phi.AAC.1